MREFRSHESHIFDVKFDVRRIVRWVSSFSPFDCLYSSADTFRDFTSTSHDQKIIMLDFGHELDTSLLI